MVIEAIHLGQQLIERLLALVVAAKAAAIALLTDGIDLIDKDDTRSFLICLLEEVPDLRGTHADEHLNELRAGRIRRTKGCCDPGGHKPSGDPR